jgi:hypothetical protein
MVAPGLNRSFGLLLVPLTALALGCGGDDATQTDDDTSGATQNADDDGGPTTNPMTAGSDDDEDSDGPKPMTDDDTGDDTGSSSGDDATTGGDAKPNLGDTTNVLCQQVVLALDTIRTENASDNPDVAAIAAAYEETPLQDAVQEFGAILGRVEDSVLIDDAAILDAIEAGTPEAMVDVELQATYVLTLLVRKRVDDVQKAEPDINRPPELLYADWDEAYCYFDGVLRVHAEEADAEGLRTEGIADDIQYGFEWGHSGIESEEASFAIDKWIVPPAKQIVEKTLFRAYDRLIEKYSTAAQIDDDPIAARRALGYFRIIEDRMEGKNDPGIAIIVADLEGDPSLIDAAVIRHELDVGWIKRVRNYVDAAVDPDSPLVGTTDGHKGGWEGRTYAKIPLPRMQDALEGFDAAAYLMVWDEYIAAIAADDFPTATERSEALVAPHCEYHAYLGLPDCTTAGVP